MKNFKQIVDKEMERSKQIFGENWLLGYFNNFVGHLPYGYRRNVVSKDYEMSLEEFEMNIEKIYNELEDKENNRLKIYVDINKVLEEGGIKNKVIKLQKKILDVGAKAYEILDNENDTKKAKKFVKSVKETEEELLKLILPAYIKLREMGYTRHDLSVSSV